VNFRAPAATNRDYADAECELLPGDRTSVIGIKPGKPDDADSWWQKP
jgi:hypothetical protein